jgi:hypothetical protein
MRNTIQCTKKNASAVKPCPIKLMEDDVISDVDLLCGLQMVHLLELQ